VGLKRISVLTLAYIALGVVTTLLFYLVTGVAQFGVHLFDESFWSHVPQPALFPEIALGFVFSRFPAALLTGIALSWCIEQGLRAKQVIALGAALPELLEIVLSYPFTHNWVGMLSS
jgi:hypothetical protein